jgi:hypothetical protein
MEMCNAYYPKLCVDVVFCNLVIVFGAKMNIALKYYHTYWMLITTFESLVLPLIKFSHY